MITGAGGALGAALSAHFAAEPDTDLVLSDVSQASLDATLAGLRCDGAVEALLADVGEPDQVEAVVARPSSASAGSTCSSATPACSRPTAASTTWPPRTGSGPSAST